jgi:hypothetical protein
VSYLIDWIDLIEVPHRSLQFACAAFNSWLNADAVDASTRGLSPRCDQSPDFSP